MLYHIKFLLFKELEDNYESEIHLYFEKDEEPSNFWHEGRICRVVRKIEDNDYGDAYKAFIRASAGDVLIIVGPNWRQLR